MTPASPERQALHAFLAAHRRLLLTTHVNPDGDGLGSEVAFAMWMAAAGKEVCILNDSPVPPAFGFLAEFHPIELFEPEAAERRFDRADALVVLDTGNRARIGRLAPLLDRHVIPVAVVDHHVTHEGFGRVNLIEPEASSTGEIVYDLIRESDGAITPPIAEALYVALITDTGTFRFSNTDTHAHRMAAELLTYGLDPQKIHAQVYSHASPGRLRFWGEVLSAMEVIADGRIVVLDAAPEQFEKHGLVGADTESLVDIPRAIAGVDVVALFSEVERGKVKVSLRSNGRVKVDQVVTRLGGGGHPHAAGVSLQGTREEARARLLPDLVRLVSAPVGAA